MEAFLACIHSMQACWPFLGCCQLRSTARIDCAPCLGQKQHMRGEVHWKPRIHVCAFHIVLQ